MWNPGQSPHQSLLSFRTSVRCPCKSLQRSSWFQVFLSLQPAMATSCWLPGNKYKHFFQAWKTLSSHLQPRTQPVLLLIFLWTTSNIARLSFWPTIVGASNLWLLFIFVKWINCRLYESSKIHESLMFSLLRMSNNVFVPPQIWLLAGLQMSSF